MTLRVTPGSTLKTLMANVRKATEEQGAHLQKLSSGKRVEKAADDSASLSRGAKIEALVRSQNQAARNANDGISFVQTAEGGLNEISNILVRLRELSIQSSSDTVGDKEREHIDKEYSQLVEEVDRIADSTSFNGTNVINGDGKGVLSFQVGAFSEDHNKIEFDTDGNYADSSVIGINGTSVATKEDALDNVESIDSAIMQIAGQRAHLGSIQSRLQHAVNNLEVSTINHDAARSKMVDVDVADSATKLASATMLKKGAIKSLSKAMDFPITALKLIE